MWPETAANCCYNHCWSTEVSSCSCCSSPLKLSNMWIQLVLTELIFAKVGNECSFICHIKWRFRLDTAELLRFSLVRAAALKF